MLVIRYLRAFGPARPKDMSTWCGLTHLGASFESLRSQLVTFIDEKGREHFDLPRAPRPAPDTVAPPRLLGPWEALLLSYEDRSRFLRSEHRPAVFTNNGIVRGTAWVDGMVAGVWDFDEDDRLARIVISPLQPLSKQDQEALMLEARRVLQTVQPQRRHEIAIGRVCGSLTRRRGAAMEGSRRITA